MTWRDQHATWHFRYRRVFPLLSEPLYSVNTNSKYSLKTTALLNQMFAAIRRGINFNCMVKGINMIRFFIWKYPHIHRKMGILMSEKQINIVLSQNDSWQCYNVKKGEKTCFLIKHQLVQLNTMRLLNRKWKNCPWNLKVKCLRIIHVYFEIPSI